MFCINMGFVAIYICLDLEFNFRYFITSPFDSYQLHRNNFLPKHTYRQIVFLNAILGTIIDSAFSWNGIPLHKTSNDEYKQSDCSITKCICKLCDDQFDHMQPTSNCQPTILCNEVPLHIHTSSCQLITKCFVFWNDFTSLAFRTNFKQSIVEHCNGHDGMPAISSC